MTRAQTRGHDELQVSSRVDERCHPEGESPGEKPAQASVLREVGVGQPAGGAALQGGRSVLGRRGVVSGSSLFHRVSPPEALEQFQGAWHAGVSGPCDCPGVHNVGS